MTRALPFTAAGIARAIKGAEKAGKKVTGIRADGSLILGDNAVTSQPSRLGQPAEGVQPDPFVMAAERFGHAEAKRKRNGAPS